MPEMADHDARDTHFRRGTVDEDGYRRQLTRIREERVRYTGLLEKANE